MKNDHAMHGIFFAFEGTYLKLGGSVGENVNSNIFGKIIIFGTNKFTKKYERYLIPIITSFELLYLPTILF